MDRVCEELRASLSLSAAADGDSAHVAAALLRGDDGGAGRGAGESVEGEAGCVAVRHAGWLGKRGEVNTAVRQRYFVLDTSGALAW